jgi:hypothetical protein
MAPPEHFTPAPGRERCTDCHVVHAPPSATVAPADATPGRPPFRFEIEGEAEAPVELAAFRLGPPPSMPESQVRYLGMDLAGSIRMGWRHVSVNGSERLHDQHIGLDAGFRVFDLSLDGSAPDGPVTRVHLSAEGIDDPVEHYRFEARDESTWSFSGKASRQNLVYRATGDPRDLSARKNDLGLELTTIPDAFVRVTAGYDFATREGDRRGARRVTGVANPVPSREPLDEVGNFAFARFDIGASTVTLGLMAGYHWERLEEDIRARDVTSSTALEYGQDTKVRAPVASALLSLQPDDRVELEGKIVWTRLDTETDFASETTAPGTVVRSTGDVDGEREFWRGAVGATWLPSPELSASARVEGFEDDTDSDSVSNTGREDIETDHRRWRLSGEVEYRAAAWASVRGGYEWMYEDYERDGTEGERNDNAHIEGPFLGADLDPTDELSIDVLYRFVRVDDPFADVSGQDEDRARARVRYRPSEELTLTALWNHRLVTNELRDTEVLSRALGFTAVWQVLADLSLAGSYDHQVFSTETDAVRFIGGVPERGRSDFSSRANGANVQLAFAATSELTLEAGSSFYDTSGDFPTELQEHVFGLEYEVSRRLSVGTDLRYVTYDEDDEGENDFDAFLAAVWLRLSF